MRINELTINVMTELDMYRAIDIIDTVLGKDYVDADNFKSMLTDGAFQCVIRRSADMPNEPNETTYAAMEESERLLEDSNAKRFSSIEELFEDLDA